jgi:hypothetical protein
MASHQVKVTIVCAQGFPITEDGPEVFCVGEIHSRSHKHSWCFQTKAISGANPVWNHQQLWTEYEEGDTVAFTLFTRSGDILGKAELESDDFRSWPFEGELALADAGEGVAATLTVRIAALDEEVPFVIERVRGNGPMPLHDLVRPQDAPHKSSEIVQWAPAAPVQSGPEIKQSVQTVGTTTPKVMTMTTSPFNQTTKKVVYRSKPIGVVNSGITSSSQTVRIPTPQRTTLPMRIGSAVHVTSASLPGTGRLTPSFPLGAGRAGQQPRGVVYQHGPWTTKVPRSTFTSPSPRSTSQARFLAPTTSKVAMEPQAA